MYLTGIMEGREAEVPLLPSPWVQADDRAGSNVTDFLKAEGPFSNSKMEKP